jgi:ATP-dependent Clp protease ATP-binding subunit ClpA
VKFNPLARENMLSIVEKFVRELNTLAADKHAYLELTSEASDLLAELGYDPKMGARPLSRVINEQLKKPLSRALIFGELRNGGVARAMVVEGKIVLNFLPAQLLSELVLEEERVEETTQII